MSAVVGVKLSTNNVSVCLIPDGWDWKSGTLKKASIDYGREDSAYGRPEILARLEIHRCLKASDMVVQFVKGCAGVRSIAVEGYPYSKDGVMPRMMSLIEVGGIVKSQVLLACRLPVVPAVASAARSFVIGGLSRGVDQKTQVDSFLKNRGFRFDSRDEMGAFVVACYQYCFVNDCSNRFLPQQSLFD